MRAHAQAWSHVLVRVVRRSAVAARLWMPPVAQDLLLVAVLAAIQASLLGRVQNDTLMPVLVALEPLPLLLRRSAPLLAMTLVGAADVGLILTGTPMESVGAGIVVAAYSAGAHQPRSRSLVTLAVGAASLVAIVAITGDRTGNADRLGALLVVAAAWWIGTSLRERRAYAAQLERQAEVLERQADALRAARTELAEHAVAAERLRLARELHDVVAHSLAIVALHSSVGAHNAAHRPQDASRALDAINTATRAALAELRALLAVLREGNEPDTAPLPSLADLSTLASQAIRAGSTVDLSVTGSVADVPKAVSLSAYRIVQEALTNAVKHASPTNTTVAVSVGSGMVTVTVTNSPPGRPHQPVADGGSGLTGMRERVAAFGGDLAVGPTAAGGWAVRANLPYQDTSP